MITKFKLFEALSSSNRRDDFEIKKGEPKLGDFIIANVYDPLDFIKNNLGRIWKNPHNDFFIVKYENIPEEIKKYFSYSDYSKALNIGNSILVHIDQILHWSESEKDLEHIMQSKKYNI